jgi:hypothetical protein
MRKALTVATAALVLALGMPLAASTAKSGGTGSLTGRTVDVSGRAVAGQRIELLRGTQVVSLATTSLNGTWMFPSVTPGTYVVRTTLNGKVAGVRVTVRAGDALAGTLIVVPAVAAAPQIGVVAGALGGASSAVVTAATAALATATAATQDTVTLEPDAEAILQVLTNLTPEQRQDFAEALIEAIEEDPEVENAFATPEERDALLDALEEIVENPSAPIPPLPGNNSGL